MKYKTKKAKKHSRIIPATVVGIIAVLFITGLLVWLFVFAHTSSKNTTTKPSTQTGTTSQSSSTTTDKPNKTVDTKSADTPTGTGASQSDTSLVITDASQSGSRVEVRAYVNTIEDGICTYTFTLANQKIVKQTSTLINGTTISCTTLDVDSSEFITSGTWQLKVSYQSSSSTTTAESTKTVDIQGAS